MTPAETAFLRRAIALSAESDPTTGDRPFGAVIVRDGQIVGEGRNRAGSAHDPSAHGEIVAIRNACAALGSEDLGGCTLYTSCEPCPMCEAAIGFSGIERVVFATSLADALRAGAGVPSPFRLEENAGRPRMEQAERPLVDEAVAVLQSWVARHQP